MDKAKEFLKEYEKLCQKYGIGIRGCGCCGSPYLQIDKSCHVHDIDFINYDFELNKILISDEYKTIDEYFEEV